MSRLMHARHCCTSAAKIIAVLQDSEQQPGTMDDDALAFADVAGYGCDGAVQPLSLEAQVIPLLQFQLLRRL